MSRAPRSNSFMLTRLSNALPDYADLGFPVEPERLVQYVVALLRSKRELYEEERDLAADMLESVGRSPTAMKAIRRCFPKRRDLKAKRVAIDYLVQLELAGPRHAKRVANEVGSAHKVSEKSVPTYLKKHRAWAERERNAWLRTFDQKNLNRRAVLERISEDVRDGAPRWIK